MEFGFYWWIQGEQIWPVHMETQSSHLSQKTLFQGGHKPVETWNTDGILWTWKLVEFSGNPVQPPGKIITNKIILTMIKYLCKNCWLGKQDPYDLRE